MEPVKITETPQPTLAQRALRWALYSVIGVAIVMGLLFVYWLLQSDKVLEVENTPFPVHPPELAQQDSVFIHAKYCKRVDARGNMIVRLVGKRSITRLPYTNENQAVGCYNNELPIPIPEFASDDTYFIEFEVTYDINPLKKQVVTMRSEEFTVKAR